ncbi:hypothetical protein GUJ93_ZPchr0007g5029 [Zizania palustris]|uniref:Uncharacterized protein n=1 Tax=Zizania palustris TaxID=103762 RepID=A0A8J5T921_ZIZPA|nr:hypothetical protein GUJ93_ZPchr0007g5029 [Zizania palustris]
MQRREANGDVQNEMVQATATYTTVGKIWIRAGRQYGETTDIPFAEHIRHEWMQGRAKLPHPICYSDEAEEGGRARHSSQRSISA